MTLTGRRTSARLRRCPVREAQSHRRRGAFPGTGCAMTGEPRASGEITTAFTDLPALLLPGDLLVVNTSPPSRRRWRCPAGWRCTSPARCRTGAGWPSSGRPRGKRASYAGGSPGDQLIGAARRGVLRWPARFGPRLWRARLSAAVAAVPATRGCPSATPTPLTGSGHRGLPDRLRHGRQRGDAKRGPAVHARGGDRPGGRGMSSRRSRCTRGVIAGGGRGPLPGAVRGRPADCPAGEPDPAHGGRVIAVGTTVVRALETAAATRAADRRFRAGRVDQPHRHPEKPSVLAVDGLITGLHEPRSSHLRMLAASAGLDLLSRCYGRRSTQRVPLA